MKSLVASLNTSPRVFKPVSKNTLVSGPNCESVTHPIHRFQAQDRAGGILPWYTVHTRLHTGHQLAMSLHDAYVPSLQTRRSSQPCGISRDSSRFVHDGCILKRHTLVCAVLEVQHLLRLSGDVNLRMGTCSMTSPRISFPNPPYEIIPTLYSNTPAFLLDLHHSYSESIHLYTQ